MTVSSSMPTGKSRMKSYVIADEGILVVSIPARNLVLYLAVAALIVELAFGFLPAVVVLLLGYYLLWYSAAGKAKDESAIVQGKASRLLSVRVIKWSDIRTLSLIGMKVVATTPAGQYRFSLRGPNTDTVAKFLNVKLSDRLLILNDNMVMARQNAPTRSRALKVLAVVSAVASASAFVAVVVYPSAYLAAFAAGGLMLAFDSSLLYGLKDPNTFLSRTYRMMSYAGLLLLNISIPAFYSVLIFGPSDIYLILGWIMVIGASLAGLVIRRIVRG